jgi:hypothetical protein
MGCYQMLMLLPRDLSAKKSEERIQLHLDFCAWYYPCWAQYAWHSVYGLRTNEDCRGSHRLQLKKQLQGTWSVSCSAWIGCIHSNKTQMCCQTSSIVQSSQNQLQCLQQQKHSCHGKDSNLKSIFWQSCHCLCSWFNHLLLW